MKALVYASVFVYEKPCRKLDTPIMRRRDVYQQRFLVLLAGLRGWSAVPIVVATNLLCVPEDLGHFYCFTTPVYRPNTSKACRLWEIGKSCFPGGRTSNWSARLCLAVRSTTKELQHGAGRRRRQSRCSCRRRLYFLIIVCLVLQGST